MSCFAAGSPASTLLNPSMAIKVRKASLNRKTRGNNRVVKRPWRRAFKTAAVGFGLAWMLMASSGAMAATKVIFLTSGSNWTVPSDWNNASNTVECVGAGGTGGINVGGSGGAYAKRSNVSLTPGGSVGYAVGTATTTLNAHGGDTWFSSTSILECAGGDSGGATHGDLTFAGGAGGTGSATHDGPGGGGAAGPHGAGAPGGNTSGTIEHFAGAGGAGDNGNAAGGSGGANHEVYGGSAQGGNGSSEALWTQTTGGAVAGPGGGGGGSGSGFPNVAVKGGAGGLYGGGSGAPGRGSPDASTNTAGQSGIIVITYTPSGGSGSTVTYTYDTLGRLTCSATSDGYYTVYGLDHADNRTQVTTSTTGTGCTSSGQAPSATDSMATVSENSSANNIPLSLSGGAPTMLLLTTGAANGTAMVTGPATISYTPNANYSGGDSFQYTASNGYGTSSPPANVTITVSAAGQPIANAVTTTVAYNSTNNNIPLSITGGAATSVAVSTAPSHGTATASGVTIKYTPTTGFANQDTFYYTASNAAGTSAPAKVTVNVVQAPVANAVTTTVAYNSTNNNIPLSITGGAATSVAVSTAPSHGTATASGVTIKYTPTTGFANQDTFYYTASNAAGTSAPAKVTVNVSPQAPIAGPVMDTVGENSMYNTVPLNISGGTATSVAVSTAASHGIASWLGGTTIEYSPSTGFTGTDYFQYTATNSAGTSAPALVTMTVSATTPPPIANPVMAPVAYNAVNAYIPLDVTGGAPTSVSATTAPSHGTTMVSGTIIQYTPTTGFSGQDSFYYNATNSGGTSAQALITVTVASPNTHVSPNPIWADINASDPSSPATGTNSAVAIQGIQVPITLELDTGVSTGRIFKYSKNGGAWTVFSNGATISVSPNDTLAFSVTKLSPGTTTGSITVLNQSDANTVLDMFFFSVTAGNN